MTTDYEKQLEEDNYSLKNLLDERTKELDEAKKELERWKPSIDHNQLSPGVTAKEFNISPLISSDTFVMKSHICLDDQMFTAADVANLKHLWSLHMQKVNNPPLLYRIWRKIVLCLTMKKN
jgi:hypothetical protein